VLHFFSDPRYFLDVGIANHTGNQKKIEGEHEGANAPLEISDAVNFHWNEGVILNKIHDEQRVSDDWYERRKEWMHYSITREKQGKQEMLQLFNKRKRVVDNQSNN